MKHATVKETASGKFFISLTFDVDIEPIETRKKFDRIEAFDYSMPSLAVSASGENDITKDDIRWYRNLGSTALPTTGSRNTGSGSYTRRQQTGGMTSFISSLGKSPILLMPS